MIEMRKAQILMNNPVYLGLSTLDLSKTVMYEFWYDYVKPNYGGNAKLYFMDTDSFLVHAKTDDVYKDIVEEVETRFDTSNFELERSLPKGKNKKSDWINEKWLEWTNHERICWVESKLNSSNWK